MYFYAAPEASRLVRTKSGGKMNKLFFAYAAICFSFVGAFPPDSLAEPSRNVLCYRPHFRSIAKICSDDLYGFYAKATFQKQDGSRCYLERTGETSALEMFSEGYHYSLATFAAQDGRAQLLRFRYDPSGYEQVSYNAVALHEGEWLTAFELVKKSQIESPPCETLRDAGFE